MKTKDCYTELAIQISTLDMKLDAILKLLNKPEVEVVNVMSAKDHIHTGVAGNLLDITLPPQWPNESHTDYLKRIGRCNEAQSDDEYYGEVYK